MTFNKKTDNIITMKLKIDNKEYTLDTKRAVELGVLKENKPITLTLTLEEAQLLRFITGHVINSNHPRLIMDKIWTKLCEQNVNYVEVDRQYHLTDANGNIIKGIGFKEKN